MKETLIKISLVLFGLIVAVAIGEAVLRIAHRGTQELTLRNYLKSDPVAEYDIVENIPPQKNGVDDITFDAWSNNIGCFDTPYNGENVSVLLVGDSFTWGVAPFEQKWGTLLEKEIGGRRVLKCGVLGYGTKQELFKAEKVMKVTKKNPELIIVGYFTNDLGDDYVFPQSAVVDGIRITKRFLSNLETGEITENTDEQIAEIAKRNRINACDLNYNIPRIMNKTLCVFSNLELYKTLKNPAKNLLLKVIGRDKASGLVSAEQKSFWERGNLEYLPESKYPWLADAWKNHLENLKTLKTLADKHGARLLVMVIPSKEEVYPFLQANVSPLLPPNLDYKNPYKILDPFFEKEHIDYLDLLPFMESYADRTPRKSLNASDLYYVRDGHWNANGNRLAALILGKFVLEHDYLSIPSKEKTEKLETIQRELDGLKTTQ